MSWKKVGSWLKDNAQEGAALVGSLLTGNVPGAIAAGAALVSDATGTSDPEKALSFLQHDPNTMLKLKELAAQENQSIRSHLQRMYELELDDKQHEHSETQMTIRNGDTSEDPYVRHTRPKIARQSWYVTGGYIVLFEVLKTFGVGVGATMELALVLIAPAGTYLGWRSLDKITGYFKKKG